MPRVRKEKKGAQKPPLSFVDKGIYIALILLGFATLLFLPLFFGYRLPMKIAFADETVVACRNTVAMLCMLPVALLTSVPLLVLASHGMKQRQPIFGNKRYIPPPFEPAIKTYPLLSREFWRSLSGKTKRRSKRIGLIFCIFLLAGLVILPLGFHPRTVLDRYDNFVTYNVWNEETDSCSLQEAERLEIHITHCGRRRDKWGIQLTFVFSDTDYKLNLGSFYSMTIEETLEYMLYLKRCFGEDRYEIGNVERVESFVLKQHLTSSEAALVYELFDYTE